MRSYRAGAEYSIPCEATFGNNGLTSPLLANVYLSVLDRHFARTRDEQMSPPWRRQYRRRTGRPNYRLIRYADNFVVLVHGTKSEAEDLKSQISVLLAGRLKMTLSDEKTHINDGFISSASTSRRSPEAAAVVSCSPSRPRTCWRR